MAREALVNVVKHAEATRTSISLVVRDGEVVLEIIDDGHGFAETVRRSGVANLEHRAVSRGGVFDLQSGDGGTRVLWRVPYATVDA